MLRKYPHFQVSKNHTSILWSLTKFVNSTLYAEKIYFRTKQASFSPLKDAYQFRAKTFSPLIRAFQSSRSLSAFQNRQFYYLPDSL